MSEPTKLLAVYWEWTEGKHKGGRFWAIHAVENDGRLQDWPSWGMTARAASAVTVVDGEGLELIEHLLGPKSKTEDAGAA